MLQSFFSFVYRFAFHFICHFTSQLLNTEFSFKLNSLNTRFLVKARTVLWQASKRNRMNHCLEIPLLYSLLVASLLIHLSISLIILGFIFAIFPINLPSREIWFTNLQLPESPSPIQNAFKNLYHISHLLSFDTEANLSTRLHTTVSSLAISYLSSFGALAWIPSGPHDLSLLILLICS